MRNDNIVVVFVLVLRKKLIPPETLNFTIFSFLKKIFSSSNFVTQTGSLAKNLLPVYRRKARLKLRRLRNMAANALSKFSRIFGRRSAVVIGMIHVQALPGNVVVIFILS